MELKPRRREIWADYPRTFDLPHAAAAAIPLKFSPKRHRELERHGEAWKIPPAEFLRRVVWGAFGAFPSDWDQQPCVAFPPREWVGLDGMYLVTVFGRPAALFLQEFNYDTTFVSNYLYDSIINKLDYNSICGIQRIRFDYPHLSHTNRYPDITFQMPISVREIVVERALLSGMEEHQWIEGVLRTGLRMPPHIHETWTAPDEDEDVGFGCHYLEIRPTDRAVYLLSSAEDYTTGVRGDLGRAYRAAGGGREGGRELARTVFEAALA